MVVLGGSWGVQERDPEAAQGGPGKPWGPSGPTLDFVDFSFVLIAFPE